MYDILILFGNGRCLNEKNVDLFVIHVDTCS